MDPQGRQHTLEVVRCLVASGTTVVLTTHYLEEAQQMADRLAIMHHGRIVRQGALQELRAHVEQARVSFSVDSSAVDALPALPQTEIIRRPGRCTVVITTPDTQAVMTTVAAWAGREGVLLRDLQISQPSLEDIFVDIVRETDADGARSPVHCSSAANG
jgi:ABC-2 type transport system ATP-binding protein